MLWPPTSHGPSLVIDSRTAISASVAACGGPDGEATDFVAGADLALVLAAATDAFTTRATSLEGGFVASFSAASAAVRADTSSSRTTLRGSLPISSPLYAAWRRRPSSVHSVNSTRTTRRGADH